MRTITDSYGTVTLSDDVLWGANTERSRNNFRIGSYTMPKQLIHTLVLLKKACAMANAQFGKLTADKADAIVYACDRVLAGEFADQFPLCVWQTGSGTQTNMNVNEVIAAIASERVAVHPNDDVNMSQSTNDIFPSAINVAALLAARQTLYPALEGILGSFDHLTKDYADVQKVGRTHCQDAVPMSVGAEFFGMSGIIRSAYEMLCDAETYLRILAVGGTAVGNGLNAPSGFGDAVCGILTQLSGEAFTSDTNKYHALSCRDGAQQYHAALTTLATGLMKIANDIRLLASGPRAGLGELILPTCEAGSSIMPGKVNPTQCEQISMVGCEVLGNNTTIITACSQGQFQLNVYMPVIAFKLLESIELLSDAIRSFDDKCVSGITVNTARLQYNIDHTLMTATALNTIIGYDCATALVKYAAAHDLSLTEANRALKLVDEGILLEAIKKSLS